MKRCPECRRDYYDDTLLYCLEDGNALVQGSVPSPDEPATAILSVPPEVAGSLTRPTDETDMKTAILQPPATTGGSDSRRIAKPLLAVLAVLVVAGIGFGIYKFATGKQTGSAPSFESMKITKLTDTGKAGSAAISPDGKYVVHVKEDGQQSLWVRHIATGSNVQIIPPAELVYGRTTFSPDGSYIYFIRRGIGERNYVLYQLPVLGGDLKTEPACQQSRHVLA
ncbi:MAG: PD40 domain-containing protein [Acidobacteria bacterium]|nr:PD40 domain-containing protein [Acidobacteriota bacterium]